MPSRYAYQRQNLFSPERAEAAREELESGGIRSIYVLSTGETQLEAPSKSVRTLIALDTRGKLPSESFTRRTKAAGRSLEHERRAQHWLEDHGLIAKLGTLGGQYKATPRGLLFLATLAHLGQFDLRVIPADLRKDVYHAAMTWDEDGPAGFEKNPRSENPARKPKPLTVFPEHLEIVTGAGFTPTIGKREIRKLMESDAWRETWEANKDEIYKTNRAFAVSLHSGVLAHYKTDAEYVAYFKKYDKPGLARYRALRKAAHASREKMGKQREKLVRALVKDMKAAKKRKNNPTDDPEDGLVLGDGEVFAKTGSHRQREKVYRVLGRKPETYYNLFEGDKTAGASRFVVTEAEFKKLKDAGVRVTRSRLKTPNKWHPHINWGGRDANPAPTTGTDADLTQRLKF